MPASPTSSSSPFDNETLGQQLLSRDSRLPHHLHVNNSLHHPHRSNPPCVSRPLLPHRSIFNVPLHPEKSPPPGTVPRKFSLPSDFIERVPVSTLFCWFSAVLPAMVLGATILVRRGNRDRDHGERYPWDHNGIYILLFLGIGLCITLAAFITNLTKVMVGRFQTWVNIYLSLSGSPTLPPRFCSPCSSPQFPQLFLRNLFSVPSRHGE